MVEISQNVNIEMLEKLPDGTYKRKYPKTRADNGTTFDEHLADNAAHDKIMVTGEYVGDNASSREIVLGFQPNIVIMHQLIISNASPVMVYYRHGDYGYRISSGTSTRLEGASAVNKERAPLITPNGFLVGYSGDGTKDTNYMNSEYSYVYMAIK